MLLLEIIIKDLIYMERLKDKIVIKEETLLKMINLYHQGIITGGEFVHFFDRVRECVCCRYNTLDDFDDLMYCSMYEHIVPDCEIQESDLSNMDKMLWDRFGSEFIEQRKESKKKLFNLINEDK